MITFVVKAALDDASACGFGNFDGLIGAKGIEDNHVVAPGHSLQAARKHLFLIKGGDQNGDHAASFKPRGLRNRAGFPATTVHAATSRRTLDRAPTTAPSPTLTPGPINASAATHAPSPILIGLVTNGSCGCSISCEAVQRKQYWL